MRFLTAFALVALAEMATFFWVESRVGLAWALGAALTTALLGSVLVKRAGVLVLARIREKWSRAEVPARELIEGAAILVAGAFLISPGFLTDAIGFFVLIPWARRRIYAWVSRRFADRISIIVPETGATTEAVIDVEEIE